MILHYCPHLLPVAWFIHESFNETTNVSLAAWYQPLSSRFPVDSKYDLVLRLGATRNNNHAWQGSFKSDGWRLLHSPALLWLLCAVKLDFYILITTQKATSHCIFKLNAKKGNLKNNLCQHMETSHSSSHISAAGTDTKLITVSHDSKIGITIFQTPIYNK